MTPASFLIPLVFGVAIGAAATWAAHHPNRIVHWVHGARDSLSGLWDDHPVPARPQLTVVHGGRHLGRGHCRRLPRDPTVRLYDFETDGGGGAAS